MADPEPQFQIGDRVRWKMTLADGVTTYGVSGHLWGTVIRREPTGLPPVTRGMVIEPFIYYVHWDSDHIQDDGSGHPFIGSQLEVRSAVERLGEIADE